MKAVVTGSSGFLGRHVVRQLLDSGMEVVSFDLRPPEGGPFNGEQFHERNLLDRQDLDKAIREAGPMHVLVWLAAHITQQRESDSFAHSDIDLMVRAPLEFLDRLPDAPDSVVHISSIEVYGRPRNLPVDESHPTDPFTLYGVAKLCAEHFLRIACEKRGVKLCNLRLAFIYGPGQHRRNVIPLFMDCVKQGKRPVIHGTGAEIRDDIFVKDIAVAIEQVIRKGAEGVFNISSGRPHTLKDVADAVCALSCRPIQPEILYRESSWVDRWYTIDRARKAFGFDPKTDFPDGLKLMWDVLGGSS
ncbi:MAG: NAD(P)-dependent oxidoreductase [Nitrospiraceae bacterium]|nr:MAG: NAD(P)-dependent oxidoreductase [Nitrospiraceae bacterium]